MSTASDLLPPSASCMLPDVGGDLYADDDAAGYQAMMSELPTIVSMSGLLDGDFDELNEIQNLLAPPVSDDDEEGHAAAAAAVAAEVAEEAYIQAMVPNPIPNDDFMSGMDVSATVAALDENLGFPSASLVSTTLVPDPAGEPNSSSLSVKAPTKRVYKHLEAGLVTPLETTYDPQPPAKKAKASAPGLALTPAPLRTSLDGVSAPNPLLFGRPIQIPTQSQMETKAPEKEPEVPRVSLKPRAPLRPTRPPRYAYPPIAKPLEESEPPKPRLATNPMAPEIISSYPAPTFITSKLSNRRPPLCKLTFKGMVEPSQGTLDSAIARIPAPPKLMKPANQSLDPAADSNTNNNNNSATASKKKASNKKKKTTKAKKKAAAVKAKKTCSKQVSKTTESPVEVKAPTTAAQEETSQDTNDPSKDEELIVANPLANVPPAAAPVKTQVSSEPSTEPAPASSKSAPAVVSSNNSAASEAPEELAGSSEAKKPSGSKPVSAEEKAQACRDRNRQHARNTRLRKKAYVEELKHSLMDMVEQRDRDLAALKDKESKKEEQRAGRKRAIQDFLELRGRNEQDEAKWTKLVKDPKEFKLTLPSTRFRKTVHGASPSVAEQVLVGVQDIMTDAAFFATFLQSLGNEKAADEKENNATSSVYFEYQFDGSPFLMDGSIGILAWTATTCGAVSKGAKSELQASGTIRATFCSETEKLLSAKLMFDTGVIQAQLRQATPSPPHV